MGNTLKQANPYRLRRAGKYPLIPKGKVFSVSLPRRLYFVPA
jgi:hypothetical protein